ncbi:MAG: GatB/YqeY domain-containing protein [Rhodospirillales bacterium]|nr:GatB/YqeY domain-containing protein [Rhodospirillales bacterium]
MLRDQISDTLKESMKSKDGVATSTCRLILAALKDRDIADRSKGNQEGIGDDAILGLLQSMIKQRREAIQLYRDGNRTELAEKEQAEIDIIERFLPAQLSDADMAKAVQGVIDELGAGSIKEMGRVMGALKEKYAGRMDFAKASGIVKEKLG